MKKSIKRLITVFAVCAVSAFAVVASGCNLTDKIKEKIEQARCEHEWNDGEVTKEATCMEKGELTKTCTLCEKVETEEIELVDHIAVYVQAVTPTCLERGLTDGTVCSVCEMKISGFQEIPALGHIVVKDSAIEATCLEDGLTEGEHCSRCDEVLNVQEKVPATGHSIVEVAEIPANCTASGVASGVKCELCDKVYSGLEEIPMLDHVDTNGDSICDECSFVMDYIFDDAEVYTERAVTLNESVSGKWYRFYYDENARLDLRFVGGFEKPDTILDDVGFMIYVDTTSVIIQGLVDGATGTTDSSIEFVLNEAGNYVDFYIPDDFVLNAYGVGSTTEKYSVQFTADTSFSSVSQLDKLFVLEVKL